MKKIKISATKARNDFFNLVQDTYLSGNQYLIEKNGIPMAQIIPIQKEVIIDDLSLSEDELRKLKQLALLKDMDDLRSLQNPTKENSVKFIKKTRKDRMDRF